MLWRPLRLTCCGCERNCMKRKTRRCRVSLSVSSKSIARCSWCTTVPSSPPQRIPPSPGTPRILSMHCQEKPTDHMHSLALVRLLDITRALDDMQNQADFIYFYIFWTFFFWFKQQTASADRLIYWNLKTDAVDFNLPFANGS